MSRGSQGVWGGTSIKLFRVQEVAMLGPSLGSPRGAVDAVGSNLVQRIGSLGLRAGAAAQGAAQGARGGGANGNGNGNGGGEGNDRSVSDV